ncbi:MAG: VCBS repeat-containing protein [Planctomycetota bacterium]|nr:VCBS repeat-containing protein [Planctomycetota bacterium]
MRCLLSRRLLCLLSYQVVWLANFFHQPLWGLQTQEPTVAESRVTPWKMHVIDHSSRGADGVRLADFNGDGRMDIVTGWEEGGLVRVYQNPGPEESGGPWPAVTVGKVRSPEDAVFVDLDSDGRLDVVSCCEGATRSVYVHWAPASPADYLDPDKWKTEPVPCVMGSAAWMFALPADVDRKNGMDLFIGSKGAGASVGWLESPRNPRQLADWKYHEMERAGWIMSLRPFPSNGTRPSLLVSDRKGDLRGVYVLSWSPLVGKWNREDLFGKKYEFMFLDVQSNGKAIEISVATRNSKFLVMETDSRLGKRRKRVFGNPAGISQGKAIAAADIDLDGQRDFVCTFNTRFIKTGQPVSGIHWLENRGTRFESHPIAEPKGKKFDRMELLDLDGDGDLDLLTCEEAANLGVIWFENPTR